MYEMLKKNSQSPQNFFFLRDLVCFTTCFGQLGHLQVTEVCTEYVGGN